ncbi:MAG TPA: hypothetical protein VJU13_05560 [Candidatus Nitrosocosmicus sp.]|nr:hypothetical protein [Candidatus Nitrosocosmicus sp.]
MQIRAMFVLILLLVIFVYFLDHIPLSVYSQNLTNIIKNSTWTSISKNLTLSLELIPRVPVIDESTRMQFEVRNLNHSNQFDNIRAKVTLTDHDGRLYKFENRLIPLVNGQFSVNYIFPDDGEHRVIVQLYQNVTPYTISAFDIVIPHPVPQSPQDKILAPLTTWFDSILFAAFLLI